MASACQAVRSHHGFKGSCMLPIGCNDAYEYTCCVYADTTGSPLGPGPSPPAPPVDDNNKTSGGDSTGQTGSHSCMQLVPIATCAQHALAYGRHLRPGKLTQYNTVDMPVSLLVLVHLSSRYMPTALLALVHVSKPGAEHAHAS